MLPLAGLAFVSDERRSVYLRVLVNDASPQKTAADALRGVSGYLRAGNFRPTGRFWEMMIHGVVYETAEATGVAPHVVLGGVRIVMAALVAAAAVAVVLALTSAAQVARERSLVGLFPLVVGAVLVANGTAGALAQFPHMLIGSVALVLAMALFVSRDRDLARRPLRLGDYVAMASSGALCATFYDLAYVTPLLAAGFLCARAWAAGLPWRAITSTASARRWAVHAAGFAAVFIPVRVLIWARCADGDCYAGSDLSLSLDAVGAAVPRLATGFAPVGWGRVAELARSASVDLGFEDLVSNAFITLIVIAIAATAAACALGLPAPAAARRRWSRDAPKRLSSPLPLADHLAAEPQARPGRLAVALVGFGTLTAVTAASVNGLSLWAQQRALPVGQAWRETLLTQIAWAFVAAGCLAALDSVLRGLSARRAARTVLASALAVALTTTLLANWRFAEANRHKPAAVLTAMVSQSSIVADRTPEGNALRCTLIAAYAHATVDQPAWKAGPAIGDDLNLLWLKRRSMPYCDPHQTTDSPGTFVQDPQP